MLRHIFTGLMCFLVLVANAVAAPDNTYRNGIAFIFSEE